MKHRRNFILGGRIDPVSLVQRARVIELLREAHPRWVFVDSVAAGAGGDRPGRVARGYGHLQTMLLRGEIDIVVVVVRELPLRLQPDVVLAAVPQRGNPFDALIAREELILDDQPEHARLAVTEQVIKGQLLYYRPDLVLREESADVQALNGLMAQDEIDGFVTAASGIEALNQQDRVVEVFTTSICTPAPGQGAVALVARAADREAHAVLSVLNDPPSMAEIELERAFVQTINREGKGPVGVLANVEGNTFEIEAAIAAPDGSEKVGGAIDGTIGQESEAIEHLAGELLAAGGTQIIKQCRE